MPFNIIAVLLSALIPTIVGFLWYNPNVFGKAWMQASGMTEEKAKESNMAVIFGVSLLLSVFLAFGILPMVIHQMHYISLMVGSEGMGVEGSDVMNNIKAFLEMHGDKYRTFGHGALHGGVAAITLALPILGTNAMFEGKGFKYIAINVGYWFVTMMLMGGLICAWQ